MRQRYNIQTLLLVWITVAIGCQKHVPATDVIAIHATSLSATADGSSLDTIYADLPINTTDTYRGVTFHASSGLFANGFDTISTFAVRTDIDPSKITAVVVWQASLRSGPDTLSATSSSVPQYMATLTLTLVASPVDSIELIPESYTVKDTFGMQDSFTAILLNAGGGKVSMGGTVAFTDLINGAPAGGYFLPPIASVDSSQVAVAYFPPLLTPTQIAGGGAYIQVQSQAYDATGKAQGRPATKLIFISP